MFGFSDFSVWDSFVSSVLGYGNKAVLTRKGEKNIKTQSSTES